MLDFLEWKSLLSESEVAENGRGREILGGFENG